MTREEILAALEARFPDAHLALDGSNAEAVIAPRDAAPAILAFMKAAPGLEFDHFVQLAAVDWLDRFELLYYLYSYTRRHTVALKVALPRDEPSIGSVSHLWGTAQWHENEAFDLFGVVFQGHPWPRRIFTPDGWEGYPMRKDFTHPNLVPKPWI